MTLKTKERIIEISQLI